jgi:excisionase family DNA binding protein
MTLNSPSEVLELTVALDYGQRSGKAATNTPSYLSTGEVAGLLLVSPKTVSRWAKEGKLPFMKTLGGHRRYPEAEIRELAEKLRQEPTA